MGEISGQKTIRRSRERKDETLQIVRTVAGYKILAWFAICDLFTVYKGQQLGQELGVVHFTGLLLGLSGTDLVSWVLLMSDDSWSQES